MDHHQTSAENTDLDESFEDANEAKVESKTTTSPSLDFEHVERPSTPPARASVNDATNGVNLPNGKIEEALGEASGAGQATNSADVGNIQIPEVKADVISTPPKLPRRSFHEHDKLTTQPLTKTVSGTSDHADVATKSVPRSRFPAFAAALPSVPWGPPPKRTTDSPSVPVVSPGALSTGRKVAMTPFGWLTRTASSTPKSPPLQARAFEMRRNTSASVSTTGSASELTLKGLEDIHESSQERKPAQPTLRERFKMLRLREETGGKHVEEADNALEKPITDTERRGSQSQADEDKRYSYGSAESSNTHPSTALSEQSNGLPVTETEPIDWDFWQTVVNEGPQAVARSSPEELTRAVSSGIPQTIRGVIWQVLAGSKNEDLESVYYELRARGTKDEIKDHQPQPTSLTVQSSSSNKERESVASSRSSITSDHSTPATSANVGPTSPSPSHEHGDPLHLTKSQTQQTPDRAKRIKDDAAALIKLEKTIRKDLGSRTSYSKYTTAASLQEGLFNVCKAYALFDEGVGYPQGLNFIIMPILFVMSEEEAFCLLVRLMNKYQLRELFIQDMPGLHLHLYQFERLLEDAEPALYVHLNRRGVTPRLYATQWFLTLFAYRFPLQLVMRVYDLVLCEGLEAAILKFGLAVVQRNAGTLLGMNDMQALTTFLKERLFDVYIDQTPSSRSILESGFFGSSAGADAEVYRGDLLVQEACAVKLTPEMLSKYRAEWDEKSATEKARETELENLRTDVVTKAAQIRSLEKRAEKSDAEHIQIANELVRLKVENTELVDENESLKGQVEELRKVADSEAAKVEEKMRAGTELVMQRNIEVQNANRHMEDQMAEMERELVSMKMKYAELGQEHETLRQRWNDLKKALG